MPIVLNTSFNENEPIVMTPEHAVETFAEDEDGPARARQPRRPTWLTSRSGWRGPTSGADEARAVEEVLDSGFLTMGPKVVEFEDALAGACEVPYAVAVSSGTAALHLAVLAAGIGPGDEVIVPAYTFPATANVVALAGARPVLVDVDPATMNLDLAQVSAAVTDQTRAVLAVHLFGRPLDWDGLVAAVPDRVALLEDAAGALGARSRDEPAAASACSAAFPSTRARSSPPARAARSRPPGDEIADAVRRMRHHGIEPRGDFEIAAPGPNYRLADILCAVGIPQLLRLDELLAARARVAAAYTERLAGLRGHAVAPTRATSTAGRPTSCSSTGGTKRYARCASRASRRRSARTPSTGSPPIASTARSRARTPRTSVRSRCRSTRGSPTPSSTASPKRYGRFPDARPYAAIVASVTAAQENRSRTRSRPASPKSAPKLPVREQVFSASRRAPTSPGGTWMPVSPSATRSSKPPTALRNDGSRVRHRLGAHDAEALPSTTAPRRPPRGRRAEQLVVRDEAARAGHSLAQRPVADDHERHPVRRLDELEHAFLRGRRPA